MKAFHGKQSIKTTYLERVQAHILADEVIKGKYWEAGKGCAVGCTIHSSNHNSYETELGIPEWLARVEDVLFEGMSNKRAKHWPKRFLAAIRPGADLEKAKTPFLVFVLQSTLKNFDHNQNPDVLKAINEVIRLHENGGSAADSNSAAWSARLAAESAWSARLAAESARLAAESAWSARLAAESAWSARLAAYEKFANKLIQILRRL